jgi:hypothetical protein
LSATQIEQLNDMEPMHQWRAALGNRTDEHGRPRSHRAPVPGQLLQRYPIPPSMRKKRTTPANPDPEPRPHPAPEGRERRPAQRGRINCPSSPVSFRPHHVFQLTSAKTMWRNQCFVLEEQMSEPRFGFDVSVTPQGQPQGAARAALGAQVALCRWPCRAT